MHSVNETTQNYDRFATLPAILGQAVHRRLPRIVSDDRRKFGILGLCHSILPAIALCAMTGGIAGDCFWVYVWSKETKHDRSCGALSLRSFLRGHLLYPPNQWYEAGILRNLALDFVGLRARNVGHNSRGQPGCTTSDPSKLVGS
jgi:hypothetical protein